MDIETVHGSGGSRRRDYYQGRWCIKRDEVRDCRYEQDLYYICRKPRHKTASCPELMDETGWRSGMLTGLTMVAKRQNNSLMVKKEAKVLPRYSYAKAVIGKYALKVLRKDKATPIKEDLERIFLRSRLATHRQETQDGKPTPRD